MKDEFTLYINRYYIKQIYDKLYKISNSNYGYNYFYRDFKNNIHIILSDKLEKNLLFCIDGKTIYSVIDIGINSFFKKLKHKYIIKDVLNEDKFIKVLKKYRNDLLEFEELLDKDIILNKNKFLSIIKYIHNIQYLKFLDLHNLSINTLLKLDYKLTYNGHYKPYINYEYINPTINKNTIVKNCIN